MRNALIAALVLIASPAAASPPEFWGDGVHDDADALEAIFEGCPVLDRTATQDRSSRVHLDPDIRGTVVLSADIKISREIRAYKRRGVHWAIVSSIMIGPDGRLRTIKSMGSYLLPDPATEPQTCPAPMS